MKSHAPLLEFWDPSISRKQFKLETSNLEQRLIKMSIMKKMQNLVKGGSDQVT